MEKAKLTKKKKRRVGQNVFLVCICQYKSTKVTRIPQLLQVQIHISKFKFIWKEESVLNSIPAVSKTALPAAQDHPFLQNHGPSSTEEARLTDHFAQENTALRDGPATWKGKRREQKKTFSLSAFTDFVISVPKSMFCPSPSPIWPHLLSLEKVWRWIQSWTRCNWLRCPHHSALFHHGD